MKRVLAMCSIAAVSLLMAVPAVAQTPENAQQRLERGATVTRMELAAERVQVPHGRKVALPAVTLYDAEGREVDADVRFFSQNRGVVTVTGDSISASEGGDFRVIAVVMTPEDSEADPVYRWVDVQAEWAPVRRVVVTPDEGRLYAGTMLHHAAAAFHADDSQRPNAEFTWVSSDPSVVQVDAYGNVVALKPGRATVTATMDGVRGSVEHRVEQFPAAELTITGGAREARTGDVLAFEAVARDRSGRPVADLPVTWTATYTPAEGVEAPGAVAEVRDGRFVGEAAGVYTVIASAGPLTARTAVRLHERDVVRPVQLVGRGAVSHVHTSDIWPFTGVDGRDYAVTGTWGGDGWAYFWDITDPANVVKVDSVQVDARTVNDVKVSPDGRYAALGREGASNRRNGVVLIDLADPRNPQVAANYDENLTGGVHNLFATDDYLFALSGGDKYVILDVRDIYNPTFVSEYNHPDSYIHDVWVHDGMAYSSEWGNGVVVVDVGNGRWGGTIENPVFVTNFPVPTGATHAAFPYFQEETGKFYLFLGDEIMQRRGMAWAGSGVSIPGPGTVPGATWGYVHIVDFTDPENPEYVARYEVEEFGTHNMWVEDDVLYQAYYEGGMRMVDVSGELMGDLRAQGREIAVFKPFDPDGYVSNAPFVWGGFTHKGHLFLSDFNSGLWSVKLEPEARPAT